MLSLKLLIDQVYTWAKYKSMKRGLRASAKSIEPGQPVRAWAKAFVCQRASSTLTLSQTTILDSSKHKKFADDNS